MRMLSSIYENFDEKLYDVNKHISVKLYNYIFSKVELILFFFTNRELAKRQLSKWKYIRSNKILKRF